MYNDQIPGFNIIGHGTHNISDRDGFGSRQSRGNSVLNYIIRFGLGFTTPEISRPDASKYNIITPRVPQLQGVYHGTTEEHSQSRL